MPAVSVLLALVVAGAGCGDYSLDFGRTPEMSAAARRRPALWTMFDIRRAQLEGRPVAPTESFPEGLPNLFLNPQPDGKATLKINPAFSEGDAAAFVVPEIWVNFDIVWVQPWYFLVTAWNERSPQSNRWKDEKGENVPPVWDVGPRSLFYSPLWLVFYAVVPPNTPTDRYTTAQRIFDDKLPIYAGPPIIYSVRPSDVGLDAPMPVHPYLKTPVGLLSAPPRSFVDGEEMAYFVEGGNNWRYNEKLEAEEVPLFFLARRDASGTVVPTDWPPVMGSGPLFARRPVDLANGRPRFGGYSRFHFAVVSQTAEAFNPDLYPEVTANLLAKGFNPELYRGRVANNGRKVAETDRVCFTQPEFPAGCNWLDSQARVEDTVGVANIIRTEVSACSPLVFYGGKGIGR